MKRENKMALDWSKRAGDAAAFDIDHAAFNARLFTFLARLAQRRDVAEDLLEETWMRLVTHAPGLRPDTNLAAWLFTVARNLHASYCRARLVEHAHAAGLALWLSPAPQASPFEALAASETLRQIETSLAALPVAYREALLLVAAEGLSPSEASAVCGISPEAMRQRLSRARAFLARRLQAAGESGLALLREVKT
jgi:RNA polymerase sigma-70 factor (ECF subfamily)